MADGENDVAVKLLHPSETASLNQGSYQRVIFVRHGQTHYNLACTNAAGEEGLVPIGGPDGTMSIEHNDYFDGGLTEKGLVEAQHAALTAKEQVELVVVSPLERAICTALAMFPDPPGEKLIAHEGVREVMYKQASYTKRLPVSAKQQQYSTKVDFSCLPSDEDILFDSLSTFCETREEVVSRAATFLQWLQRREERCIMVVCHGLLMRSIFEADGLGLIAVSPALGLQWTPNCVAHEASLLLPSAKVVLVPT
jgi:broad specificity phosphatase PhoE